MKRSSLPRQTLVGQIVDAKRAVGRPMLLFNNSIKRDKSFEIDPNNWVDASSDRDS